MRDAMDASKAASSVITAVSEGELTPYSPLINIVSPSHQPATSAHSL